MPNVDYDEVNNRLSRIEDLLKQAVLWIKIGNLRSLRELLVAELDSKEKMMVYELSDGINTQQEIANRAGVSRSTVSYNWQKWLGLGLVAESSRAGRMKKVLPLEEVGISIPRSGEKEKRGEEMSIQPQDLSKILNSSEVFSNSQELADFAFNILPGSKEREQMLSRPELVSDILNAFEASDNLKRALFIQALERRVYSTGYTQFRKYFEDWEKHIAE